MTIKILFLALLLAVSVLVMSKCFSTDIPNNNVKLSLTPLACFVKNMGDTCHLTINVNWQSTIPLNACLYQNDEEKYCWSKTHKATKKIKVSLSKNMQFTLQGDNSEVYAQQHISIAASTSKKYRRRLRADWSLF